jgi:tRNA (guanine-N7-)-methyltransferase
MRMRKKKNLVPRMGRCEAVHVQDGFSMRGHWRDLMPEAREVWIELGCGKGRFTADTAAENPDVLLIAIEKVADAQVVAMERAVAAGLTNVFFVVGDAATLPELFAPDEADRIFVNFCDPWPSKRHAKRRLTHRGFLLTYRRVLKDGGQLHFKTDNAPLFAFSLEEFPAAGFALSDVTDDLHREGVQGVMTDYEAKFHAEGLPIHRCVGTKGPYTPPGPSDEDTAEQTETSE